MFTSVAHFFNVLIFLDLTLAILSCILLIKVSMRYGIKFISIPIIILSTFMLLVEGEELMGRAYDSMPTGKFEFLDYRVQIVDGVKKLEIWILQDKKSRLYVFTYTPEREQELSKAKSRKKKGARERGEFMPGDGKERSGGDLSISDIPFEELMPQKEDSPNSSDEPVPDSQRQAPPAQENKPPALTT